MVLPQFEWVKNHGQRSNSGMICGVVDRVVFQ
jgi:hypothetical protein